MVPMHKERIVKSRSVRTLLDLMESPSVEEAHKLAKVSHRGPPCENRKDIGKECIQIHDSP